MHNEPGLNTPALFPPTSYSSNLSLRLTDISITQILVISSKPSTISVTFLIFSHFCNIGKFNK